MRHKFRLLSAFTVASACSGQLSATNRVLGLGFVIPHILLHIVVCEKKNLNTYHLIIWQQGWLLYRPSGCPWVSSKQCLPVSLWGCGSSFSSHCNFPFPISLFAFCIFLSPWFAYTLAMGFVQFHINFFSMRLHANQYHKENTVYGIWYMEGSMLPSCWSWPRRNVPQNCVESRKKYCILYMEWLLSRVCVCFLFVLGVIKKPTNFIFSWSSATTGGRSWARGVVA